MNGGCSHLPECQKSIKLLEHKCRDVLSIKSVRQQDSVKTESKAEVSQNMFRCSNGFFYSKRKFSHLVNLIFTLTLIIIYYYFDLNYH